MKLIVDDSRKYLDPQLADLDEALAAPGIEFIELVRDDRQRLRGWHDLRSGTWELFHSFESTQVWRDGQQEFDTPTTQRLFRAFMAGEATWDAGVAWRSPLSIFQGKTFLKLALGLGVFVVLVKLAQVALSYLTGMFGGG